MDNRAEITYNEATRDVRYTGDITDKDAMLLVDLLDEVIIEEPRDPINLYLFTYGGAYDATMAIYDYIKWVETPINTIACGTSMSGGTLLVSCGTGRRLSFPNARFMIHGLHHSVSYGSHVDNSIELQEDDRINDNFIRLLAEETNNSVTRIEDDLKRDRYLSAEEAMYYGLIDEIIGE